MFVDTGLLHSGASDSCRASSRADDGANHLARTSPVAGMFGDFPAAHEFREAIGMARAHHATRLRAHQEILSNVGDKARTAAADFTAMEQHNAAALRAARWNSAT